MPQKILTAYGIDEDVVIKPFGTGLINNTWLVYWNDEKYILQKINSNVFKKPFDIADNIKSIGEYVAKHFPEYPFVTPINTIQQQSMVCVDGEYFRLFPFVKNSHTVDVVSTTKQAFEAAKQFGLFTKLLSNFNSNELKITLPDFHNLPLRYNQFETALTNGNKNRITAAKAAIDFLIANKSIVTTSENILASSSFKKRVTHHDTKISNVLFDENDNGICVIDLDTVMPGYFISDVGDMMRTYLSPVNEEENNFSKIEVREDYFKAIAKGYLSEMQAEFSKDEINHFTYAGKFMIYMQALRFLTDYINNDIYYGAKYEGHNFIRAKNQIVLLQKFMEKEKLFDKILMEMIAAK